MTLTIGKTVSLPGARIGYVESQHTDAADLLAYAEQRLGEVSRVQADYTVAAVDLAAMRNAAQDTALRIGQAVRVVDLDFAIDITLTIVEMSRPLDNPADVQIELADVTRRLDSILGERLVEDDIADIVADVSALIETTQVAEETLIGITDPPTDPPDDGANTSQRTYKARIDSGTNATGYTITLWNSKTNVASSVVIEDCIVADETAADLVSLQMVYAAVPSITEREAGTLPLVWASGTGANWYAWNGGSN